MPTISDSLLTATLNLLWRIEDGGFCRDSTTPQCPACGRYSPDEATPLHEGLCPIVTARMRLDPSGTFENRWRAARAAARPQEPAEFEAETARHDAQTGKPMLGSGRSEDVNTGL
jgi:hypothetical protein